jgi:hypothetical protein
MGENNFNRLGLILSNLGNEIQQNANNLNNVADLRTELINRMDQMSEQIVERITLRITEDNQRMTQNFQHMTNNIFHLQQTVVSLEQRMMIRLVNAHNILSTAKIEYINVSGHRFKFFQKISV